MAIRVNFSSDEAASTVREIPPSGEYLCFVDNIELKEVNPQSDNAGKPYWNIMFKIADGTYANSRLFSNVMLFEGKSGTLSALAQFLKAVGFQLPMGGGEFVLPDAEDLIGKQVLVRGSKKKAETVNGRELRERFNVTGYKPATAGAKASGPASLLP